MKELFEKALDHPIATIIIIGSIGNTIANIITAVKGNPIGPIINIATLAKKTVK